MSGRLYFSALAASSEWQAASLYSSVLLRGIECILGAL